MLLIMAERILDRFGPIIGAGRGIETFLGVVLDVERRAETEGARGVDEEGVRLCGGLIDGAAVGGGTTIDGSEDGSSCEVEANAFVEGCCGKDGGATAAIDAGTKGVLNGERAGWIFAKGVVEKAEGGMGSGLT